MALSPTGYAVAGAGTTAANGNYVPVTGANATLNGATQYTNGTDFLAFNTGPGGPFWGIAAVVNQVGNGSFIYNTTNASATTTNVPLTGWSASSGAGSAPTLTVISGGGGGATTPPTTAPVITATSGPGSNAIGYTASSGTGVIISRGTATGGPYTALITLQTTASGSYNDASAVVGTAYFYTAVFTNSGGNGPVSNEATATATQAASATAPSGASNVVAVTPNASTGNVTNLVGYSQNTAALLAWTNPAQLTSVTVNQRLQVTPGTALNPWVSITNLVASTLGTPSTIPTSVIITGLTNGIVYEFDVVPNA